MGIPNPIRLLPVMEDKATLESDLSAGRGLAGRQRLNTGAAVFLTQTAALENRSNKLIPRASRVLEEYRHGKDIQSGKTTMEC